MTKPRLIDANEVHTLTGFSVYTILRMARQGRIPARKVGQRVRFLSDEIEAWFAELPKAGR